MILLSSGAILGIVVAIVAVIAIVAFIVYKVLNPKLKSDNEKPSEEQALREEMDRMLKPIDDDETAKKVAEYKDKEDE